MRHSFGAEQSVCFGKDTTREFVEDTLCSLKFIFSRLYHIATGLYIGGGLEFTKIEKSDILESGRRLK